MRQKNIVQRGDEITLVIDGEKTRISKVVRQYDFAFEYNNFARLFANKAKETDNVGYEKNAYIVSSIIFACSFLEAAQSEFFSITSHSKDNPLSDTEKRIFSVILSENLEPYGDKNPVAIFNMILRILGKQEMSLNCEPCISTRMVFRLRNMLVHPDPDRVVEFDEKKDQNNDQNIVNELRKYLVLKKMQLFQKIS
jgi:hypothetical protein